MSVTDAGTTKELVSPFAKARLGAGPEIARRRAFVVYHTRLLLAADGAARAARVGREKVVNA